MDKTDKIIKKLENHDRRFDGHDKRLDSISKKLLEHDDSLREIKETMATRGDIDRITTSLDEILVVVKRLDQERVFTHQWIRRVEKVVETHTEVISKMKRTLKIA